MTTKIIETLGVESYRKGLADCLMLIQRGQDVGLSLEDSVDAAKKAVFKNKVTIPLQQVEIEAY